MPEAYIIDAVRTPIGRKKGSLAHLHPADLGGHPIKALVERTGIDAGAVDEVGKLGQSLRGEHCAQIGMAAANGFAGIDHHVALDEAI